MDTPTHHTHTDPHTDPHDRGTTHAPAVTPVDAHVLELGAAHVLEGEDVEGVELVHALPQLPHHARLVLPAAARRLGERHWTGVVWWGVG